MEITNLAYVAGLFDGDGCVYIHKELPSKVRRTINPSYQLSVAIANTDEPILIWLRDNFEGQIANYRSPKKDTHKQEYQWRIDSRKAQHFLTEIVPFLRIKKLQVEFALQFQTFKDSLSFNKEHRSYTKEEIDKFEFYKITLQELKKNDKS